MHPRTRRTKNQETDIILMGTVDETAATFGKMGGTGVAVHVDHAQDTLEMSTQESGELHP